MSTSQYSIFSSIKSVSLFFYISSPGDKYTPLSLFLSQPYFSPSLSHYYYANILQCVCVCANANNVTGITFTLLAHVNRCASRTDFVIKFVLADYRLSCVLVSFLLCSIQKMWNTQTKSQQSSLIQISSLNSHLKLELAAFYHRGPWE